MNARNGHTPFPTQSRRRWLLGACAAALLCACTPEQTPSAVQPAPPSTAAAESFYSAPFEKHPDAAVLTAIGRVLFSDPSLSASGRMSCASCHDPAHAYGPPNKLATQFGGRSLAEPGLRAVPSLKYGQDTPPFSEHFSDTDGDDSADMGPTGGRAWDGRAQSAHEQAALPLLSSYEMGNANQAEVVDRLRRSPNAGRLSAAFGPSVLKNPALAWNALLLTLEVFQQSPEDFYPYDSKYDAFLRRQAELTPAESRGLALFNDKAKGNCALCHVSNVKRGAFPQFTDRGFIAIGVPRNAKVVANADPKFNDLGLCGPLRTDLTDHPEYCGLFKTPTLRNVATRSVFFHNGVFTRLEDAVRFYAQRDTRPGRFYGRDAHGKVHAFDDLPKAYQANLNREAPFDRAPGAKPALSDAEVKDIVAFLGTLTDGYGQGQGHTGR